MGHAWRISALATAVLLTAVVVVAPARAADLSVADINVLYTQQTLTQAEGTVTFNIRFQGLDGDPGNYDLFSAQVLIAKLLAGAQATFTLDEFETENTAPLAPDYWIQNVPTGHQNASLQQAGTQFRFSDFVPIPEGITPSPGEIVARFVVHFDVASPEAFGSYQVLAGQQQYNRFSADLVNHFHNSFAPGQFELQPIPEPATLALFLLGLPLLRRRR